MKFTLFITKRHKGYFSGEVIKFHVLTNQISNKQLWRLFICPTLTVGAAQVSKSFKDQAAKNWPLPKHTPMPNLSTIWRTCFVSPAVWIWPDMIGMRTRAPKSTEGKMVNGRETLRLRSKGAATVQEVVSSGTCSTIPLTHWHSDMNTPAGVLNRNTTNKQPYDESPDFHQRQQQFLHSITSRRQSSHAHATMSVVLIWPRFLPRRKRPL